MLPTSPENGRPHGHGEPLKKLEGQPKTVEEHFAEKRAEWIADVEFLVASMEGWLAPLVGKKLARVERRTVELDEPDTGPSSLVALTIHLGDREVRVEPRGMRIVGVVSTGKDRIIGARGRVDIVSGPSRATMLQLARADGWPSDRSAVDLTANTLAEVSFPSRRRGCFVGVDQQPSRRPA